MMIKFDDKPYRKAELALTDALLKEYFNDWDLLIEKMYGMKPLDPKVKAEVKEKPKPAWAEISLGNGLRVKDVIINEPAVVVRFNDGTKVVSKVDKQDTFSPEMGLLLGICKKLLGSSKTHELLETYVWNRGDK